MITIEQILSKVLNDNTVLTKHMIPEDKWSMDVMLKAVEEIGKGIDPRFVLDDQNREFFKNIIYWFTGDSRMTAINPETGKVIPGRPTKGLYIAGNTGSGKTVATKIIAKLHRMNPFILKSGTNESAYGWVNTRSDEIVNGFLDNGDFKNCYERGQVLCIQDLGAEPKETLYMGNRINVMRQVIERRGDMAHAVTVITSNIPLGHKDLIERYGDRACSRMVEMMNYLQLVGKDRRKNI